MWLHFCLSELNWSQKKNRLFLFLFFFFFQFLRTGLCVVLVILELNFELRLASNSDFPLPLRPKCWDQWGAPPPLGDNLNLLRKVNTFKRLLLAINASMQLTAKSYVWNKNCK